MNPPVSPVGRASSRAGALRAPPPGSGADTSSAPFPLTPALSLGERENIRRRGTITGPWGFLAFCLLGLAWLGASCGGERGGPAAAPDPHLATNGTVEVTAQLIEIPDGAIFKRDLYDYATILKYRVVQVHRGTLKGDTIYVGHYNPWKPRAEAPDKRVQNIGGDLKQFRPGQVQRMALDVPIEDFFMGGIVNKYFGRDTGPLYWAVWTDLEKQ
jgi:hypothetical protein